MTADLDPIEQQRAVRASIAEKVAQLRRRRVDANGYPIAPPTDPDAVEAAVDAGPPRYGTGGGGARPEPGPEPWSVEQANLVRSIADAERRGDVMLSITLKSRLTDLQSPR